MGLRGSAGSGHQQAAGARAGWAEPEGREAGMASCRRGAGPRRASPPEDSAFPRPHAGGTEGCVCSRLRQGGLWGGSGDGLERRGRRRGAETGMWLPTGTCARPAELRTARGPPRRGRRPESGAQWGSRGPAESRGPTARASFWFSGHAACVVLAPSPAVGTQSPNPGPTGEVLSRGFPISEGQGR